MPQPSRRSRRPAVAATLAAAALLLGPALSPLHAASGGTGTYAPDAQTVFPVADAVAFHRLGWDGEQVIVLLAAAPLDHAAWAATLDPAGFAETYEDANSFVELEYGTDGSYRGTGFGFLYEGGSSSGQRYHSEGVEALRVAIADGKVSGRLRADFPDGAAVDLTLAAPLLAPTGEALPAGGGEPGAAAVACHAAFAKKDLAGVGRACATQSAEIIDSAIRMRSEGYDWADPWTPEGVSECDVAAVAGLEVTGGIVRGDEARVEAAGGWTEGRRCAGSVYLRREDGRWRVSRSALALLAQE